MVVKVPTRCLHWCQPSVPHSPSSPRTFASSISSSSSSPSIQRIFCTGDGVIVRGNVHGQSRLEFVGFRCQKLYITGSLEQPRARGHRLRSTCSTGFDLIGDDECSRKIQDVAMKFEFSDDILSKNNCPANGVGGRVAEKRRKSRRESCNSISGYGDMNFVEDLKPFECFEPPEWSERDEINLACVERKVNSLEIPLSLRMIQRKKQWKEGVKEVRESACSSVKKAFSSMVFIIQELHSCTLQMREMLFYEDLQGILGRAQKDMQASFVWLFQQVFSHTPTLMVSVMILLANYSVYSMANNTSIAYAIPLQAYAATTESVSVVDDQSHVNQMFDLSKVRTFLVSSSSGKTTSINGNGGGGGKCKPVASSTDGEGSSLDRISSYPVIPDGPSSISNPSRTNKEESVSGQVTKEEELRLWNSIVEAAAKMQAVLKGEALDHETLQRFVSPVHVNIEVDDYEDYSRTELLYQMGLAQDPNNPLLLTNYAQFLSRAIHDYDRAEGYFKKAVKVEPKDAEALDKYASFLWLVKKDLWAAEETYLEAINTDPNNSYYAANYANFLWNTGGEDTCFPA